MTTIKLHVRRALFVLTITLLGLTPALAAARSTPSQDTSLKAEIISLTNSDRSAAGLGTLTENAALSAAAQEKANDILILDIGLPDIDGYEVVHQLLLDPLFPSAIIALTGFGQTEDKEKAINAGFHHHLTKPVGLQELEKAFKKVEHIYASA